MSFSNPFECLHEINCDFIILFSFFCFVLFFKSIYSCSIFFLGGLAVLRLYGNIMMVAGIWLCWKLNTKINLECINLCNEPGVCVFKHLINILCRDFKCQSSQSDTHFTKPEMSAVSFKKLAFLLLLLFQSRGRGRENTSPLLSFRLWSNSSDGHSGCPRQRLHMSVWLRIKHCFYSLQKLH